MYNHLIVNTIIDWGMAGSIMQALDKHRMRQSCRMSSSCSAIDSARTRSQKIKACSVCAGGD